MAVVAYHLSVYKKSLYCNFLCVCCKYNSGFRVDNDRLYLHNTTFYASVANIISGFLVDNVGDADQYIQTYTTANHDDYASTYNEPQVYYDSQHYDSYGNLHETNYLIEDPCFRDDHGLCYLFENDKRFQVQANSRIAVQSANDGIQSTPPHDAVSAELLSPDFLQSLGLEPGHYASYSNSIENSKEIFENIGGLEGYVQYYESINNDAV